MGNGEVEHVGKWREISEEPTHLFRFKGEDQKGSGERYWIVRTIHRENTFRKTIDANNQT